MMPIQNIVEKKSCSICSSQRLECGIELPEFPLTGIFVKEDDNIQVPKGYDQKLMVCAECGHAQLGYVLPPVDVYTSNYAHRSSVAHLSAASVTFFQGFIDSLAKGRTFRCILEIGCNDLFLLKQMSSRGNRLIGIDPIWKDEPLNTDSNIQVIGEFLEEVDFGQLQEKPDLIISTHNLEHINEPVEQFRRLMDVAADDALFVLEVPDIDLMIDNLRFDQVFHYHLHYFGLASMIKFLERVGGQYLGHSFNFRHWGGSLCVAFHKGAKKSSYTIPSFRKLSNKRILDHHRIFGQRMEGFMRVIDGLGCDIWGWGGGQMVPSVAYNLRCDLSFLKGIYDDDPNRNGLTYPHLPIRISQPDKNLDLNDSAVMITALDGVRPILDRLNHFCPRFILVPNDVF